MDFRRPFRSTRARVAPVFAFFRRRGARLSLTATAHARVRLYSGRTMVEGVVDGGGMRGDCVGAAPKFVRRVVFLVSRSSDHTRKKTAPSPVTMLN